MTDICRRLEGKRVLVVGDAIADQFLEGSISRVSREAPVFILRHENTATVPGGAANAAANVAALGGNACLIAVVGDDQNGTLLCDALTSRKVDVKNVMAVPDHTTTTKVRVLAGHQFAVRQQVIRIDHEPSQNLSEAAAADLNSLLAAEAATADAIMISDYGYGVVTSTIFDTAKRIAKERGIPLVVDSRRRLAELQGATSATPNREEVEQILGAECTDEQCGELRKQLDLQALLVTNGNRGITLFEADRPPRAIPAVGSMEPVDVTGAGDTVIATYTMALASGASYRQAAELANLAGGLAVMKKGTATVSAAELARAVADNLDATLVQASS